MQPAARQCSVMRKRPENDEARAPKVINNAASSGRKLVSISVGIVGQRTGVVTFVSIPVNTRLSRRAEQVEYKARRKVDPFMPFNVEERVPFTPKNVHCALQTYPINNLT